MVLQPRPPSSQQAACDGLTLVAAETLRHRREPGQLLFLREKEWKQLGTLNLQRSWAHVQPIEW